jgi:small-conductance mechanosensitive channel
MSVGVSYGSDIELVKRALLEIAAEHPSVLENPPPDVLFVEFGASSLDFILKVAIRELMGKPGVLSQLRFATNKKFDELDIEMPFPQQDLHLDGSVTEVVSKMANYFEQMEIGEEKA